MQTTGEFLRLRRKAVGLTLRDVATRSGLSNSYISQLERGNKKPTVEVLARLLKALGASWPEFLEACGYIEKPRVVYRGEERRRPLMAQEEPEKYQSRPQKLQRSRKKPRG